MKIGSLKKFHALSLLEVFSMILKNELLLWLEMALFNQRIHLSSLHLLA